MKNKGFVLLETLVASTFILGVMIFLFIQFSSIKRSYETSFHYNTVPGLYHAKEFANFLKWDGYLTIDDQLTNSTKGYVDITNCLYSGSLCKQLVVDMKAKKILYVGENISNLKNNLSTSNYNKDVFSESLKRFILQMNSVEPNGRSRIIVEYKDNTYATVLIDLSDMNDVRAEYKINYYLMNVNGKGYSLKETETYTDQVYSKVSPNPKQYEGFTSPSLQTLVVDPKGISELNYYYTRNQYNFILKTGTGTTTTGSTSSGKYYYGTKISLKATTATGYTWSKWVSNSSKVTNITAINSNFTMPASDIEVTSTATLNTHQLIFNANGGNVSIDNKSLDYGTQYGELPTPNRTGYTFLGWFTSLSGGDLVTNTMIMQDEDVTIYAHWSPNYVEVNITNFYGIYDGSPHTGFISTTMSDVKIAYGTNEGNYNLGTLPTYTNAGTYVVYWKATQPNCLPTTGYLTIKIEKAIPYFKLDTTNGYIKVLTNSDGNIEAISQNTSIVDRVYKTSNEFRILPKNFGDFGDVNIDVIISESTNYHSISDSVKVNVSKRLIPSNLNYLDPSGKYKYGYLNPSGTYIEDYDSMWRVTNDIYISESGYYYMYGYTGVVPRTCLYNNPNGLSLYQSFTSTDGYSLYIPSGKYLRLCVLVGYGGSLDALDLRKITFK